MCGLRQKEITRNNRAFPRATTRQHFLPHCAAKGCGTPKKKKAVFPIRAGQGFLIVPGETAAYCAADCPTRFYQDLEAKTGLPPGSAFLPHL